MTEWAYRVEMHDKHEVTSGHDCYLLGSLVEEIGLVGDLLEELALGEVGIVRSLVLVVAYQLKDAKDVLVDDALCLHGVGTGLSRPLPNHQALLLVIDADFPVRVDPVLLPRRDALIRALDVGYTGVI